MALAKASHERKQEKETKSAASVAAKSARAALLNQTGAAVWFKMQSEKKAVTDFTVGDLKALIL